jgi:phosphatidylserine/phosphatidylglycerophosphate/cardiolipin synthase-like enzyme
VFVSDRQSKRVRMTEPPKVPELATRRALAATLVLALALAAALAAAAVAGSGQLTLVVEPSAGPAPIYRLITAARHSVELTMYELSDAVAEQDLAADAARGVRVQVILDGGSYDRSLNAPAFSYLASHGVEVRWASGEFDLTHEKSVVIDATSAAIMTLNLQSRYYSSTRDFALIDTQPADVRAIAATFAADWVGRPIAAQPGVGDLVWSPGSQAALLRLIDTARSSLRVEAEEMDSTPIEDALVAAARRGVAVRLVMSADPSYSAALAALRAAGVAVRRYAPSAALYIHAKLIEADGARLFLGSENFSTASLEYNRELGVETTIPAVVAGVQATFDRDFAGGQPLG